MSSVVELPLWLCLIGLFFASLWLLQHFLLPSARWVLRRRANNLIEEVNTRLALRIPSFKLTRRTVLVDRLTFHPRVIELVEEKALEQNVPREALMQQVGIYAREIVPAFNALVYFKAAYWVARRLVHALYRVRLGFSDDTALKQLGPESSVVFLMNHRSNMDYIIATYLAAERTALSYAVGEWARIWPLQQLIRAMGGYFVRRDSGDPLYRRVLECYVQMAAEGGVPQAVFP
ncbi:1-acyl-sn-glycerol-3-phosphate acyltransferase, partial [Granulosicoccus sp.]